MVSQLHPRLPGQEKGLVISKKVLKRQRQQAKRDLKDFLQRDPTDKEVLDFMKAAEERARAPMLSGPPQPKRIMREVTYTGMPVAKAAPKPDDAREGNPEPDSIQAGGTSTAEGGGEGNPEPDSIQAGGTLRIPGAASGSSDAMPTEAAGDADDPIGDIPKYELSCQNAKECGQTGLRWSEFLLCDVEASWAGRIWGWCQGCSGLSNKEFKRQAKLMKLQRTAVKK